MDRIDRESLSPYYSQLSDLIQKDIENGVFEPLDLIPSERALCKMHDVSRATVRQAIQCLKEKGLVEKLRGAGTRVKANPKLEQNFLGGHHFELKLREEGEGASVGLVDWMIKGDLKKINAALNLKDIALVIEATRLRFFKNEAVYIEKIYLPRKTFPKLEQKDFEPTNTFLKIIQLDYQIEVEKTTTSMEPILLTEKDSEILGINKKPSPGLLIEQHSFIRNHQPICLTQKILPQDRCRHFLNLTTF